MSTVRMIFCEHKNETETEHVRFVENCTVMNELKNCPKKDKMTYLGTCKPDTFLYTEYIPKVV